MTKLTTVRNELIELFNKIKTQHLSENGFDYYRIRDSQLELMKQLVSELVQSVIPKQPELVENLKKVMNSWLAMEPKLAYQPEFTDVMMLLDAKAAPVQPVIPEQTEREKRVLKLINDNNLSWEILFSELEEAKGRINRLYKLPDDLDFDCEFENGDYGSDEEPWLRGRVAGFNEALKVIKRSHNAEQKSTAQPVSEPYKLPVIGWIRSDYYSDRRMGDAPIFILGQNNPSSTLGVGYIPLMGNSPVIPDGWKLVPIEPTEEMIVRGFESRPDESFSEPEAWEEYAAMSGCKQAAHRAKLCWAAMLAAAPTQESK